VTFIELMQKLEQELGYHQWPVNPVARELRDIFDNSPVNGELAIKVMRGLYKSNGCQKPADDVSLDRCNDALVPIRLELIRSKQTDIDAVHFINSLCHAVDGAWRGGDVAAPVVTADRPAQGDIVSLQDWQHRRKYRA